MDSLVSIIVPVYNVEEYLGTCVESIVNQTYKNIEIILVDDGSNDSCPQKCDAWAEKDNRIQVIHKENAGVGEARNTGLDIAQGAYVTFADSDDYLSLDAIEIMLRQIEQDQAAIAKRPFAFDSQNIIRRNSLKKDNATIWRPPFVHDIDKILHCPYYNRYTDKTQVFSLVKNDDIT